MGKRRARGSAFRSARAAGEAAEGYFSACDERGVPCTLAGLALALGFSSTQELFDYTEVGEYAGEVRRARLEIEKRYEQKLFQKGDSGTVFALKNLGWTDRREITEKGESGAGFSGDIDDMLRSLGYERRDK